MQQASPKARAHGYGRGGMTKVGSRGLGGRVARWAGILGCVVATSLDAQVVLRRDWWLRAPGGNYGLMEIRMVQPGLGSEHAVSRTTVMLGPWRRTFDATAPQAIAWVAIPSLIAAFTWGWIKTRRR